MSKSHLEDTFLTYWRQIAPDAPAPEREYKPSAIRRWRCDFAWPDKMLALEVQGGTWTGGRHSRGNGQRADYEKHNELVLMGWRVLYCTSDMLTDDPHTLIAQIVKLLRDYHPLLSNEP